MIKYNERGEVVSVNGITTGHHIGTPMQDCACKNSSDNEAYATELSTVTSCGNTVDDKQPDAVVTESSIEDLVSEMPAGGESDVFVLKIYQELDENGDWLPPEANHTFDEVLEAAKAGKFISVVMYSPYSYTLKDDIYFTDLSEESPILNFGDGYTYDYDGLHIG